MQIPEDRATIHKATATIQVVQIDDKQMTLAMFRQLPSVSAVSGRLPVTNAPCRAQDAEWGPIEPSLEVWGSVNYHFKGCADDLDGYHHDHYVGVDEDGLLSRTQIGVHPELVVWWLRKEEIARLRSSGYPLSDEQIERMLKEYYELERAWVMKPQLYIAI